jgi:hypothetical protein
VTAAPAVGPADDSQLTGADIKGWAPERIVEAQRRGRLDDYLGRTVKTTPSVPATGQLNGDHIKFWTADQIVAAVRAGRLDHYLGRGAA